MEFKKGLISTILFVSVLLNFSTVLGASAQNDEEDLCAKIEESAGHLYGWKGKNIYKKAIAHSGFLAIDMADTEGWSEATGQCVNGDCQDACDIMSSVYSEYINGENSSSDSTKYHNTDQLTAIIIEEYIFKTINGLLSEEITYNDLKNETKMLMGITTGGAPTCFLVALNSGGSCSLNSFNNGYEGDNVGDPSPISSGLDVTGSQENLHGSVSNAPAAAVDCPINTSMFYNNSTGQGAQPAAPEGGDTDVIHDNNNSDNANNSDEGDSEPAIPYKRNERKNSIVTAPPQPFEQSDSNIEIFVDKQTKSGGVIMGDFIAGGSGSASGGSGYAGVKVTEGTYLLQTGGVGKSGKGGVGVNVGLGFRVNYTPKWEGSNLPGSICGNFSNSIFAGCYGSAGNKGTDSVMVPSGGDWCAELLFGDGEITDPDPSDNGNLSSWNPASCSDPETWQSDQESYQIEPTQGFLKPGPDRMMMHP